MKKCMALFILLSGSMLWAGQPKNWMEYQKIVVHYKSDSAIVAAICAGQITGELAHDTAFVLFGTMPIQKISNGYLIANHPSFLMNNGLTQGAVAFLYTEKALPEKGLIKGYAVYLGDREYEAANGFTRKAPAFQMYAGSTEGLKEKPSSKLMKTAP